MMMLREQQHLHLHTLHPHSIFMKQKIFHRHNPEFYNNTYDTQKLPFFLVLCAVILTFHVIICFHMKPNVFYQPTLDCGETMKSE